MSSNLLASLRPLLVTLAVPAIACGGQEPSAPAPAAPAPAAEMPAAADTPAPQADAPATDAATGPAAPAAASMAAPPAPNAGDGSVGPEVPGQEGGEFHELHPPTDAAEALDLPSFSQLLGDGATVTISVGVEGATSGELAFQTIDGDGFARMLHVQRLEGGSASIVAPASYADPIYVSLAMPEGEFSKDPNAVGSAAGTPERKGAGMQVAGASEPIRLQGADVAVTIKVGETPDWLEGLAKQGIRPDGGQEAQ